MKDRSFVTYVRCGFIWFVLSSPEPPEVNGAATHVAIGNMQQVTFARVYIYIYIAYSNA